ncbi:hypothetical protein [Streptomyces sp. NPDC002187]|uniref:hypothetical protein n=1 Tax=Streptomyces sp. NPDC002187 TaxID=3364637 RepID=UPI00369F66E1
MTLIEVLLLARHMEHGHVVAGLAAAHRAGVLTSDAVALEARMAADGDHDELVGSNPSCAGVRWAGGDRHVPV